MYAGFIVENGKILDAIKRTLLTLHFEKEFQRGIVQKPDAVAT